MTTPEEIEKAREWLDEKCQHAMVTEQDDLAERIDDCDEEVVAAYAAHVTAEKDKEIARLRDLVTCLIENDPDDVISDGGHTVLEHWRHDARRAVNYASPFAVLDREKADG